MHMAAMRQCAWRVRGRAYVQRSATELVVKIRMASCTKILPSTRCYALSLLALVLSLVAAKASAQTSESAQKPTAIDALVAETMRSNPEIAGAEPLEGDDPGASANADTRRSASLLTGIYRRQSRAGFRLRDRRLLLYGVRLFPRHPGTREAEAAGATRT